MLAFGLGYVEPILLCDPSCKWIGPETGGHGSMCGDRRIQLDMGKEENKKERDGKAFVQFSSFLLAERHVARLQKLGPLGT